MIPTANENEKAFLDQRNAVISQLGIEEKISLLSGSGIWTIAGIPEDDISGITVSDGPHGVRKPLSDLTLQVAHPATCFPAGCAIAASWDVNLIQRMGKGLAKECEIYGISVLLGPAMNLKRHAAGGRNLEYYSEDPYLTGRLASSYLKGVQSTGMVGACLKHFAVNNQESHRFVVNAVVDERTLRELYLASFEMAVKEAKPAMIMGAYNQVNGRYCCEHEWLLRDILRNEWKYDGVCVTDWGATDNRIRAIKAGMDLEMPGNKGVHDRNLLQACREDPSFETCVDDSLGRILSLLQRYPTPISNEPKEQVFDANHQLAYEIALDSAVLLKNHDNLLPLAQNTKIAVIGEFAKNSRYQGMGSSKCTPTRIDHAWKKFSSYTSHIEYAPGYPALASDDLIYPDMLEEAKQVANNGDVVLLFLGLPEILESEGFDRETLELPKQHAVLLEAITTIHDNVVVVLSNGGAIELPDCIDKASAILEGYLLGQAGGPAIVDLIFGDTSPSGRLPEAFPVKASQLPCHAYFPGTRDTVEYREGLNVGYRYLDSLCAFDKAQVRFPFGHGLSYTEFEYSQLRIKVNTDEPATKKVTVRFRLTNVGKVAAKEVPECYVAPLDSSVYRPSHELKAFTKIYLDPGASNEVTFHLTHNSFAFYDIGHGSWTVEAGQYEIQIGASSQDVRLQQTTKFQTGVRSSTLAKETYPLASSMSTDDQVFANRFVSRKNIILDTIRQRDEPGQASMILDRNSLLKEAANHSLLGKLLFWLVVKVGSLEIQPGPAKKAEERLVRANTEGLPLRTVVLFSGGALSMDFMDGLIAIMNGKPRIAICKFGIMISNWTRKLFRRRKSRTN